MTQLAEGRGGGFALTEVLVAFVIVGFSLMIVFQIIGRNARAQVLVSEYEQALNLAEQMLTLEPEWGRTRGRHGDYRWQMSVEPAEGKGSSFMPGGGAQSDSNAVLAVLEVTVSWDTDRRDLTLKTQRIVTRDRFLP